MTDSSPAFDGLTGLQESQFSASAAGAVSAAAGRSQWAPRGCLVYIFVLLIPILFIILNIVASLRH